MRRFLCWLGFHDWDKWEQGTGEIGTRVVSVQRRRCRACGFCVIERVRAGY